LFDPHLNQGSAAATWGIATTSASMCPSKHVTRDAVYVYHVEAIPTPYHMACLSSKEQVCVQIVSQIFAAVVISEQIASLQCQDLVPR
jgi:hypothetical protein